MEPKSGQPPGIPKPAPSPTEHSQFFWDAAREHKLMIQRCDDCQRYIHWPQLLCPFCQSERLSPAEMSGKGSVYSYCIVNHVFHPAFAVPYSLVLVELDEQPGLRMLTNIVDCPNDAIRIGMAVEVTFEDGDGYTLPQFRPAAAEVQG